MASSVLGIGSAIMIADHEVIGESVSPPVVKVNGVRTPIADGRFRLGRFAVEAKVDGDQFLLNIPRALDGARPGRPSKGVYA